MSDPCMESVNVTVISGRWQKHITALQISLPCYVNTLPFKIIGTVRSIPLFLMHIENIWVWHQKSIQVFTSESGPQFRRWHLLSQASYFYYETMYWKRLKWTNIANNNEPERKKQKRSQDVKNTKNTLEKKSSK